MMLYTAPILALLACPFLLAKPVGAEPFRHPFGELREYHRHWLAVCPNRHVAGSDSAYERNCWASTFSGDKDGSFSGPFPGFRLTVSRDRSDGTRTISVVGPATERIDPDRPFTFRFSDGSRLALAYGAGIGPLGNSGNEYEVKQAGDLTRLLGRMRAGSHVVITIPLSEGEERIQFSLLGLRKAMRFTEDFASTNPS